MTHTSVIPLIYGLTCLGLAVGRVPGLKLDRTGIALLVWMYLLCAISIVGCEFNAEYERMLALESN